MPNFK